MIYEPMLERNVAGIREEAAAMVATAGVQAFYESVARFAVLAYAPAQHAKHALLAALAVHELREDLGEKFPDAVIECAIYAAESRLPWSEPPILEVHAPLEGQPVDLHEIRAAVREGDRLRAERWLGARLNDADLLSDFFTVATDDFEDFGHKLIVSTAAWKLGSLLGEHGRFAALRVAVWEWTAYRADTAGILFDGDRQVLLERLVANLVAARGSLEAAHAIHLFDSALEAERLGASAEAVARALGAVSIQGDGVASEGEVLCQTRLPIYSYARDLAAYLEAFAIAKRIEMRFGAAVAHRIRAAACQNLEHGDELNDWSFA